HGDQRRVAPFETPTDGYTLLGFDVSVKLRSAARRPLDLVVTGSNLLDEEARKATSIVKDLAPLPGRNFAVGLRASLRRAARSGAGRGRMMPPRRRSRRHRLVRRAARAPARARSSLEWRSRRRVGPAAERTDGLRSIKRKAMSDMPALAAIDPEIHGLILDETRRQNDYMRLIPSENYASQAVMEATGSILNNKYSEGYPGRRYY